jgi:hypothetical protein
MNRIKRALGPAFGLFVAVSPGLALAQADGAAPELTEMTFDDVTLPEMNWPGAVMANGALPPREILAEVRREGFYPVGRPVQRGPVYVLFAVDQDDFDVKLTVDAASGRVLWVAGAVARFGGPGYYGHRSVWRGHPPVPPIEVPAPRNISVVAGTRHASLKRFPPLPRSRPADLAGAPARDAAALPVAPAVTMAPVAPLE